MNEGSGVPVTGSSAQLNADSPLILDAREVLFSGYGRYWQFTTSSASRGAPDPEAVYLRAAEATGLKEILSEHVRWFIAHGTSRVTPEEVAALAATLARFSRMPDEGERRQLWKALAQWLSTQGARAVFVRMQVFR